MRISAVIATYNRRESLARCLTTLFDQDAPADQYEVVVVVDGSSDGTIEMLSSFETQGNLVVVEQENRGQTAALNAGAKAASGDIVLFLDDDLICDRGLLSSHLNAHQQPRPTLVYGRMKGLLGQSPSFAERWTYETLERYYERLDEDPTPKWPDDAWAGPNCSLPRAVFHDAGGYDEQLFPRRGEDVDLGLRLWKMGVAFVFEPAAVTSHDWVKSRRQTWRDDEATGASVVILCRKHPEYRPHCGLSGLIAAPLWKRFGGRVAVGHPAITGALFDWLIALLEGFPGRAWTVRSGERLFGVRQAVATAAGARREVGSWQALRNGFGHRVAVLLYHHIGHPAATAEHLSLTISPAKFLRQVRWLRWRGYTAITPRQWLAWRASDEPLPRKAVMLTFDDAYADLAAHALPVLERYAVPSAVFVITGNMCDSATWEGRPTMTMEQVRHWAVRGVEIGAHTRQHPDLTVLSDDSVAPEVKGSQQDLAEAGVAALSFAYPYGRVDDKVRRSVSDVFPLAFTCQEGLNDLATDPWLLRRTMVQRSDTLLDIAFRAALGMSPLSRARSRLRLRTRFRSGLRRLRPN
jgi:GT2 family glycosyltransferase/peptidoglycan/xylan/chitin deacetylase (PgdA/CDA1 family)